MSRVLLTFIASTLMMTLVACENHDAKESEDTTVSNEIRGRTDGRRVRMAQLTKVDAVARLYVGHDLARGDLLALGTKNEAGVIDALVSRPDFRTRYAARIADFLAADGRASMSASRAGVPADLLVDAFGGDAARAERFARQLTRELAPLVADELIAKSDFKTMTYRELLDAIRITAAARGGS